MLKAITASNLLNKQYLKIEFTNGWCHVAHVHDGCDKQELVKCLRLLANDIECNENLEAPGLNETETLDHMLSETNYDGNDDIPDEDLDDYVK